MYNSREGGTGVVVVGVGYELLVRLRIGGFVGTLPYGSFSGLAMMDEGAHPPSSLLSPNSVLLPPNATPLTTTCGGSTLQNGALFPLLWLFVTSLTCFGKKAHPKSGRHSQLASRRRPGPINSMNS